MIVAFPSPIGDVLFLMRYNKKRVEAQRRKLVSVPYRGCFVFNFNFHLLYSKKTAQFPSPIGDVLFLIIGTEKLRMGRTVRFPSPIGDVLFLIRAREDFNMKINELVSVPYRGCFVFNFTI